MPRWPFRKVCICCCVRGAGCLLLLTAHVQPSLKIVTVPHCLQAFAQGPLAAFRRSDPACFLASLQVWRGPLIAAGGYKRESGMHAVQSGEPVWMW